MAEYDGVGGGGDGEHEGVAAADGAGQHQVDRVQAERQRHLQHAVGRVMTTFTNIHIAEGIEEESDIREFRASHLAERMILRKVLEDYPFWEGGIIWCSVNRMFIHFSKHPFRQVSVLLFILFFKSSW